MINMSSMVGNQYLIYTCAPNSTPMLLLPPKQCLRTPKAHLSSKRNISGIFGKYHKKKKKKKCQIIFLMAALFYSYESTSHFRSQQRVVHNSFMPIFPWQDPAMLGTIRSCCLADKIIYYINQLGLCCLLVKQCEAEQYSLELDLQVWDTSLKQDLKML